MKVSMDCDAILGRLRSLANQENVAGMARYGINPKGTLGVAMPHLRAIAKQVGRDHDLAEELWASGVHEARILSALLDDPRMVTEEQMERWVRDIDSWDICDQLCNKLFRKTARARDKALEWSSREEPFVKRAGFVLMATLAVHDREASDEHFAEFLATAKCQARDDRNMVKKAINWAIRQIGK